MFVSLWILIPLIVLAMVGYFALTGIVLALLAPLDYLDDDPRPLDLKRHS